MTDDSKRPVAPVGDWLAAEGAKFMQKIKSRPAVAPKEARLKKRQNPEREAQKAVVSWLRRAGCLVSATENELHHAAHKNAIALASAAKARGKTAGWPDLTVVSQSGRIFFIEMKSDKGRLSEKQILIHAQLRDRGCTVILGRSIEGIRADLLAAGIVVEARAAMPAEGLAR